MRFFKIAGYRQNKGERMFRNGILSVSRDIGNRDIPRPRVIHVYVVKARGTGGYKFEVGQRIYYVFIYLGIDESGKYDCVLDFSEHKVGGLFEIFTYD